MAGTLVPLGLFAAVAAIVYFVSSYRAQERSELIGRGLSPCLPAPRSLLGSCSLLWGLLFLALGIAAFLYFILVSEVVEREILFLPIAALICGGALLVYHRLTAALREWGMRLYEKKIEILSRQPKN